MLATGVRVIRAFVALLSLYLIFYKNAMEKWG